MLLLLQEPQLSLQECFSAIKAFSKLSGYSINWSKSTLLALGTYEGDVANLASPYHLNTGNIRYLGINISSKLSELFSLNFIPLLKSVQDDLNRWTNLPISLLGRIAIIKMSILPKINYLFSMLPVFPDKSWFKFNSAVINFY